MVQFKQSVYFWNNQLHIKVGIQKENSRLACNQLSWNHISLKKVINNRNILTSREQQCKWQYHQRQWNFNMSLSCYFTSSTVAYHSTYLAGIIFCDTRASSVWVNVNPLWGFDWAII